MLLNIGLRLVYKSVNVKWNFRQFKYFTEEEKYYLGYKNLIFTKLTISELYIN